jgi:hypothetical protein
MHKREITELSVNDLAKIAGAAPRSVQHWAASGVLSPNPETNRAGTGSRRLFPPFEAVVACIMQPLAEHQVPIGELLRVAHIVRAELMVGRHRNTCRTIAAGVCAGWFVVFTNQTDPAAMLIAKPVATIVAGTGGQIARPGKAHGLTFIDVFSMMNGATVAFVVDLTAAFAGIRTFMAARRLEMLI